MDTENIRQYLIDFQERKIDTFPRELQIKPTKEFIVSIIGARRVGKTSLLLNLISGIADRRDVLYVDFEYPEFMDFDGSHLKDLVDLHLQLFGRMKNPVACHRVFHFSIYSSAMTTSLFS